MKTYTAGASLSAIASFCAIKFTCIASKTIFVACYFSSWAIETCLSRARHRLIGLCWTNYAFALLWALLEKTWNTFVACGPTKFCLKISSSPFSIDIDIPHEITSEVPTGAFVAHFKSNSTIFKCARSAIGTFGAACFGGAAGSTLATFG